MIGGVALYSAVDERLTHYAVDVEAGTLTRQATISLPAKLQYAWPHPTRRSLYVTTSNGGPRVTSDFNHVSALGIAADGSLAPLGKPQPLARRAVHLCLDRYGRFTLNGHNHPTSGITVHRIEADGSVGAEVVQRGPIDGGNYPHQVMSFPSGRSALIVDRGNKAAGDTPEQPGALRAFGFDDGQLSPGPVVAPGGGYGFGPRHVAFHPTMPWLYVSDERTNRLYMFKVSGERIAPAASYTRETLADPRQVRPRQMSGAIHVHPQGHTVYVANRADHSVEVDGTKVFDGGENNIAVFAIDPSTGEPTLAQHVDTHSFHVRTFACDPSGRLLVAASIKALAVQQQGRVTPVPAALSVFRISAQGRLEFANKVDVETPGTSLQYWMGMVGLEAS